jgi:hypothetical protein
VVFIFDRKGKVTMRKILTAPAIAALMLCGGALAGAQQAGSTAVAPAAQAGVSANRVIGEVTAVDAYGKKITVKADGGTVVSVLVDDKTSFKRAQPGAKNLEGATNISFTDIGVGDRVLALGRVSADQQSVPARAVVVMTKADIAQKQEHDRAEWRRRGISGTVTAINPQAREITVQVRSREGVHPVVIAAENSKVVFRRYAPDSIKFSDARPSSFDDIKVGDQVRALGDKNEDGSRLTPEEVVSGSFRTLAGKVVAVDGASNEIKLQDQQTKQQVAVAVRPDTLLKRLPPEFGAMMAMRAQGAGPGGGPGRPAGGSPEGGSDTGGGMQRPGGGPGGPRGPRGGGFDFQDVLERLPAVSVSELKPGDMIIVSSTNGADPSRVTAIAVVSGVDALLNALQARQQGAPGGNRGAGQQPDMGFGQGLDLGIGLP